MNKLMKKTRFFPTAGVLVAAALSQSVWASSHREAPYITNVPKVDGTDFYMFRSYESGREDYITVIANYLPLQDAYGGPNYFDLDGNALYEIHLDNNGDAKEDLTFQFNFKDVVNNLKVPVGGKMTSVPLKNIGAIGPAPTDTANVSVRQTYEVAVVRGDRRKGERHNLYNAGTQDTTFYKPLDNIGSKSIPDYASYAAAHVFEVDIPGCKATGRVFAGQRKEGFAVNLGEIFDLVNTNPLGPVDGETNIIADDNITSLALELPISCIASQRDPVIGGWTTASLRQASVLNPEPNFAKGKPAVIQGGPFTQVSRLGMPLVNEVVIGLVDKDRFNSSKPKDDVQFLQYVTHPSLPALLEILFADAGARAPTLFPRTDLITAFLTGVPGLNQPKAVVPSEMLRLNTSTPITSVSAQQNLGVLAGDLGGFPNGRRPGDDVVDIELRVAMGALISDSTLAPNNKAPFTDGATVSAADFDTQFPYLKTPTAGATGM
ncbi:MAG TPA: DUF4331 domain-containing protein [Dongiaceae bacterium]|nr:DUF4331 domain-containing protein [Dongiaceae bacterium]